MTLAARMTHEGEKSDEPDKVDVEIDVATLEKCRVSDPVALRAFVVRYEKLVFAYLSRAVGRGPHVEDLAQEVFLRACRALVNFDSKGPARVSTWLLTIANRVAIDARRKRRLPIQSVDLATGVPSHETPETERRRSEVGRALESAAAQLTDEQRDVFVLAEFHGLEMNELATVLGIPANTAKTRLFRARERLRFLLQDLWEDT